MNRRLGPVRGALPVFALVMLTALVAIPAMAAQPSGVPGAAAASDKPGKGPKASREPEIAVTLRGVIGSRTGADGNLEYTITVNGKVLGLDAGPSWYHGDAHPLKGLVGKTVTITGGQRGDEVDVETVDGTRLREAGKPPWAGGWKHVGSDHPGWSQEKADRWLEKHGGKAGAPGSADCWPPGHCKEPKPDASESPVGT